MARKSKADIINEVASATNQSKAQTAELIDATLDVITRSLKSGDSIAFIGFGGFSVSDRASRTARNPRTGESIEIAASKAVKFKPGKALKDAVNS